MLEQEDFKQAIAAWLQTNREDFQIELTGSIEKGQVSRGIEVWTVTAGEDRYELVRKHTNESEASALRSMRSLTSRAEALPELIASGREGNGAWIVLPRYSGSSPLSQTSVSDVVLESLAIVHAHFYGGRNISREIPFVDAHWWRWLCLEWTLPAVLSQAEQLPPSLVDEAAKQLTETADDPDLLRALNILPRTLLHGDVHRGNIIAGETHAKLIDWGSARRGTPMLDLANIIEFESEQYQLYSDVWKEESGRDLDPWTSELGWHWAQVQINTQYLGYAVEHRGEETTERMLERRRQGLENLKRML